MWFTQAGWSVRSPERDREGEGEGVGADSRGERLCGQNQKVSLRSCKQEKRFQTEWKLVTYGQAKRETKQVFKITVEQHSLCFQSLVLCCKVQEGAHKSSPIRQVAKLSTASDS